MLDHPNDGPLRLARVDPAFRHAVSKGLGVRPRGNPRPLALRRKWLDAL
jgi:hypothetical protein